jgi:GAF domain-containing protein
MNSPVETRERQLVETFVALADTLVEDFDVVELLYLLTERAVAYTSATEAGILLADEAGSLQCMAASKERTYLLELFQVQNAEGPCRDCFVTGEPLEVLDLDLEQRRWPLFAPKALSVGFRSVQAVPLRLRGQTLGAMNLFGTEPGGIGARGITLTQAMADVATIGILQQHGLHQAQEVSAQLQRALHSRIAIEQAKGVIAEQAKISVDDAFALLRAHSRNHNLALGALVVSVVSGDLRATDLTR